MGAWLLGCWKSCVRALRSSYHDPASEPPSTQNCWSWAIKRWLLSGGRLVIYRSPRARVIRCEWQEPDGKRWHFDPIHPKKGIRAIWHAYLHKGMPRRSNCFVFALRAWWRWRHRGAYWALRRSRNIAGWHWLVHYRGRWIHYEPLEPRKTWLSASLHKVWYHGTIKRGD